MIEGEINNFIMVWSVATILFCYSYTTGKLIPKGIVRLVALFPPIIILLLLPSKLTNISFVGTSAFLLSWLSTFKLFLFAFSKGPLSSNLSLSLPHFILIAFFPIKLTNQIHHNKIKVATLKWPTKLVVMSIISSFFILLHDQKGSFHPIILMTLYTFHVYNIIEILFALTTTIARKFVQIELEQPFNKPYLSTSCKTFGEEDGT
jgi:hypothetical protein